MRLLDFPSYPVRLVRRQPNIARGETEMQLTKVSKGLIAVAVLGVTGAAAWHLGVKDLVQAEDAPVVATTNAPVHAPEKKEGFLQDLFGGSDQESSGPLGSEANPLKVSIVSFHGYAPALVANGNSLKTQPGSIFKNKGVNVEFVIQDNVPTLAEIFTSETAHCAWRTSDFWAQEQPNLRNAQLDARAIMVVDNTQGADAIIARDPNIRSIEDLAGRSIALLQYTPSDGMVIDAVSNSSLSSRKKQSIHFVYVNADEGTAGVRAALEGGHVDAAALWDPDLSLALNSVPNSHVIYSTKTATNLIYDVIVCNSKYLNDPNNYRAFQSFTEGWMDGVDTSESNPASALNALVSTEEFFAQLAKEHGPNFVTSLFKNLDWTGLADNVRILGLAGGTDHYSRVYRQFDNIYRKAGALANPNSPVINPSESFDYRFIQAMMQSQPNAVQAAKQTAFSFSTQAATTAAARGAALTKPVTVGFSTGQASLDGDATSLIDTEMVPIIENNGAAYFLVSGNTDSTGKRSFNVKLSQKRAESVVNYLVDAWEFPRERFVIRGYGPDQPICNEKDPKSEGVSIGECRQMNRTTRLAVLNQ